MKNNKCKCGFKFASAGEFRNCKAFITKDGKSGVECPKCKRKYLTLLDNKQPLHTQQV